jgi:hypothetical protein
LNEEQTIAARMYANEGPLQVRIRTHERYTQPPVDFPAWVVDRVPWRGDEVVLDVGCGSGAYVAPVNARLRLPGGGPGGGLRRQLAPRLRAAAP